jgi:hypothetical protein
MRTIDKLTHTSHSVASIYEDADKRFDELSGRAFAKLQDLNAANSELFEMQDRFPKPTAEQRSEIARLQQIAANALKAVKLANKALSEPLKIMRTVTKHLQVERKFNALSRRFASLQTQSPQ